MENKSHALAAGAFVLVLSGLLIAMAIWLTRDTGEHVLIDITTRDAVNGLQPQAAVRFKGINVGKVLSIGFDRNTPGQVLVRLAVSDETPVTRSTFATLGFQGVTGIAFVELDDKGESQELLVTTGAEVPRLPMRSGLVGQLTDQGGRLLAQLEESSQRVNQLLGAQNQQALIGSITALGQAAAGFAPVLSEAGSTLQSFRGVTVRLGESLGEVTKTSTELNRLAMRVQQTGGPVDQLSTGAATFNQSMLLLQDETLPRFNQLLDEAARTSRTLGRAVGAIGESPQALIFGYPLLPGPGEPGFVTPPAKPSLLSNK